MEGTPIPEALKKLSDLGADVVGLNCHAGPPTMLPILKSAKEIVKTPLAGVPVPYRTNEKEPCFFSLTN